FVVAGAVHASFTDLALFAERFGLDIGATLPASRALDITRTGVRAFADLHLRGLPQPFFDEPSEYYPEVDVIASA
ncbi:MAG TPA: alpha/beta hydrolase, partial [Pseudonocardiaceae bacterium]|nr:alpha/beta hydrolase [Pseudonocardiaceae bacterium]